MSRLAQLESTDHRSRAVLVASRLRPESVSDQRRAQRSEPRPRKEDRVRRRREVVGRRPLDVVLHVEALRVVGQPAEEVIASLASGFRVGTRRTSEANSKGELSRTSDEVPARKTPPGDTGSFSAGCEAEETDDGEHEAGHETRES